MRKKIICAIGGVLAAIPLTLAAAPAEAAPAAGVPDVVIQVPNFTIIPHPAPQVDTLRLSTTVHTVLEPRSFKLVITIYKWSPVIFGKTHPVLYKACGALNNGACQWTLNIHNIPLPGDTRFWHFNSMCTRGRFFSKWDMSGVSDDGFAYHMIHYFPTPLPHTHQPDRAQSFLVKVCP